MRVVADTNSVVSGALWRGTPRQVLDSARAGRIRLFTSAVLLAELEDVLHRAKFARRLVDAGVTARSLVLGYAALATVVEPTATPQVIASDPDDDAVLACAVSARADVITSGDKHLLTLGEYQGIRILTVIELLALLSPTR